MTALAQTFGLFRPTVGVGVTLLLWITTGAMADNGNGISSPAHVDKELVLTQTERVAFDMFKAVVYPNITKEWEDYLKQDLFLLRWLRAKRMDLDVAARDMFQYIDFLRKNEMDKILEEDFSDLNTDFPAYLTHDRQGRPVLYASVSGWNMRREIVQGKRNRIMRYTYKMGFQLWTKQIETYKSQPNVTQVLALLSITASISSPSASFEDSCLPRDEELAASLRVEPKSMEALSGCEN